MEKKCKTKMSAPKNRKTFPLSQSSLTKLLLTVKLVSKEVKSISREDQLFLILIGKIFITFQGLIKALLLPIRHFEGN